MSKTIDRVVDECPFCGADVAEGQTECVCGSYTRQHYDTASRMRTNPRASRTPHVEHAFRQHPPSKYARFTSSSVDPHGPQSGLSDKGIRFIFGWPRGSRSSEVQSVKFRADQWTIPQAKKWLREHGYKHEEYERAQPMRKNPTEKEWSEFQARGGKVKRLPAGPTPGQAGRLSRSESRQAAHERYAARLRDEYMSEMQREHGYEEPLRYATRRMNPHHPTLPGEFTRSQLDELVREQGGSYATPEVIKAADMFEDDVRVTTRHWDEDDQPGPVYMFDCMSRMEDWTRDAPDHLWASYDRLMEEIEAAGESTAGE